MQQLHDHLHHGRLLHAHVILDLLADPGACDLLEDVVLEEEIPVEAEAVDALPVLGQLG